MYYTPLIVTATYNRVAVIYIYSIILKLTNNLLKLFIVFSLKTISLSITLS